MSVIQLNNLKKKYKRLIREETIDESPIVDRREKLNHHKRVYKPISREVRAYVTMFIIRTKLIEAKKKKKETKEDMNSIGLVYYSWLGNQLKLNTIERLD